MTDLLNNKEVLLFKKIDFWLQIPLILVLFLSVLCFFTPFDIFFISPFIISFIGYLLVSFCQLCSVIINFRFKIQSKDRKLWQIISASVFVLTLIGFINGFIFSEPLNNLMSGIASFNSFLSEVVFFISLLLLYFFTFILFSAPGLAIWYLIITWQELKELNKTNKIE